MSRWTAVFLLVGLLVCGVVYDRLEHAPEPEAAPDEPVRITPSLPSEPTLSTVWYCPTGSGAVDGIGNHVLAMTNLGDTAAVANVDLMNNAGAGPTLRLEIPPLSTETLDVSDLDMSAFVGAVVEIVGGKGAVSHSVATTRGLVEAPCGTETSDSWYFADGVTTRDATEYLVLLNPASQDVVFDVEFQTGSRTRRPKDLEAAVVPGRSVRVIDVGQYISREPNVATVITTVQGRLAVERLQFFDGQLGPVGVSLVAAVDEPKLGWYLPAGRVHDGGDQRLTLFNPGTATAELDVSFDLLEPADRASFGLVPVEVTVAPGRIAVVDLVEELGRTGLPLPAEVGVTVASTNGVGVVVERWQVTPKVDTSLIGAGGTNASIAVGRGPLIPGSIARPGQDGDDVESPENAVPDPAAGDSSSSGLVLVQPTATTGVASSTGVPLRSSQWVVPWVTIGASDETTVVVSGTEGSLVTVSLVIAGERLAPVRAVLPPEGRIQIPVTGPVTAGALVITAEHPVAAEVQFVGPGRLGVVPAVPLIGGDR